MTFHNALTANHVTYAEAFADEAARLAGTYVAADIGKSYLQSDTGVQYRLKSITPLLFVQETGIDKTTADMDIYLDDTAGLDTNNGKTVSTPFKTFTRVFEEFQDKQIGHVVKIHVVAGTYTAFPSYLEFDFVPGGQIVIDGSNNTYPIIRSGNSIASFAGVGPPNVFGNELSTELTVSPSFPPGPGQYYGLFMDFLTGNYAGKILPIHTSGEIGSDTIHTMLDWYGFANGDTFNIVDCPVKIDVAHGITIKGNTAHKRVINTTSMHFVAAGVEFKCGNAADASETPLFLENMSTAFPFCKLIDIYDVDEFGIPLILNDTKFNMDFFTSGTLFDSSLEDWLVNGTHVLARDANFLDASDDLDVLISNQSFNGGITRLFCRRKVFAVAQEVNILYSFVGGITNKSGNAVYSNIKSTIKADNVAIFQLFWSGTALDLSNCSFFCEAVYIVQSGQPVSLYDHSYFRSRWLHGGTISADRALKIGWCSKFHIDLPASRTTILGTSGAIFWEFDESNTASWPNEGNFIQKAASFVVAPGSGA